MKNKGGRPTKMTKDVIQKLEDAFTNAFSDKEACLYAGIVPETLYSYQRRNVKFTERKALLKLTPNLLAKRTIIGNLTDVKVAQWWNERVDPEMRPTSRIEHAGSIEVIEATADLSEAEKKAIGDLRIARRKRIESEARKR